MINEHGRLRALLKCAFAVSTVSVIAVTSASAQAADSGFSIGVGGGFAKASDPLSTGSVGYYMLSTLEFPSLLRVLRPRADLLFADWGLSHAIGLTGNILLSPFPGNRVAPYAIVGGGAYAMRGTGVAPGWTLGLGLRLPGESRTFAIESRVHVLRAARVLYPNVNYDTGIRWDYVWTPIGLSIQF
jgi:hypothetical protein